MSSLFSKLKSNTLVLVLLPIFAIPLMFLNTSLSMVHVWTVNQTFTHGFLVLPLVVWLLWQRKSQILSSKPQPEPRAFLLLALLLSGWLVGSAVDVNIVQQFFMISIIITSIWIIAGRQVLRFIFMPLLFLYFAVPFGQVLIPPLMAFTADFTVAMVKMMGIPIYRDGLSFTLPSGSWSVVEECSGVRYLIASFLLGSIYAYLNYSSVKKRLLFILLSLLVPIIGNGLRAFGIVMIGHFSGMKLAIGADHLLYGWVFFGFIIFLLFYIGSFWRDEEYLLVAIKKDDETVSPVEEKNNSQLVYLVITLLCVGSFSIFANHIENEKQKQRTVQSADLNLPDMFYGWKYDAERLLDWQPVIVNPDVKVSRGYYLKDDFVQLDIAYYQTQREGAEAISTSNKVTNPYGGDWKLISSTVIMESGQYFTESELKYIDKKLLIWSKYLVGAYETPSPYTAKILQAYNFITGGRLDASLLLITTPFDDTKEKTRQKLYNFWQNSAADIADGIEQTQNEK